MPHIQKKDIKISRKKIDEIIQNYNNTYKIKNIIAIKEGVANPVFIIETQKSDLVLRIFNPLTGDWKPIKEELVYALFKENKIPCPVVLKTDISKKLIPYNYVISKRLKGEALDKNYSNLQLNSKIKLVKELGKYLGKIHSLKFDKFGDLAHNGKKCIVGPAHELSDVSKKIKAGPFLSWNELHKEIIKSRLYYLKGSEFEHLIEPVKKYFEKQEYLLNYKITPRLLHLYLNRNNIFVKDDKITWILDVEESLIGHNEYDLMRTELHFQGNKILRDAFFSKYTKYVTLDKDYEKRRPFYSLSRSLVGVRCLVLWKSKYSKREYENQKNWINNHIKKILETNMKIKLEKTFRK